ncbi:MAG: crossover junction endodeoxyribonuclease RuvC [Candidatus Peregrinibacteria bacterium]
MAVFLGIDPGLLTIGFGVVEGERDDYKFVDCGVIKTSPADSLAERLAMIQKDLADLIKTFHPVAVGVEELFFAKNVTNAIKVAHARGVILLEAARAGLPVLEFTPLQVKSNICGYGKAEKQQMQSMIQKTLGLSRVPKPDDAADALGVALCTARVFVSRQKI